MNEYTLPNGETITAPSPDLVNSGGHMMVNIYYPHYHGRPEGRTIVVGFVTRKGDETGSEFVCEYDSLDDWENSETPNEQWHYDDAECQDCGTPAADDDRGTVCMTCCRGVIK